MTLEDTDDGPLPRDWVVAVCLTEASCVLIALLMPITPSRTGGRWSPAELLIENPTYLERALAWLVITNAIVIVGAAVLWLFVRRRGAG